jgi:hypothetical protein
MTTPPGDGTEPLDPATARWSGQQGPAAPEPVSLDKPVTEAPLDFDPYRFGKPDYPIAAEFAPPGYTGPVTAPQPPPYLPPAGYQPYQQPSPGQQPPPYPNFPTVPPPPPYNLQYPQPRTGNGKAIAALVLGIASIVLCWLTILDAIPIVLAIVFGVLARNEARRKPNGDGKGMAVAGIACAVIGAVLATVLTVVVYTKYKDCLHDGFGSSQYSQCIKDHT